MSLFRFKNKNQCPYTLTVKENWIIVDEVQCVLDKGHNSHHRDAMNKYQWHHQPPRNDFRPMEDAPEIIDRAQHARKK